MTSQAGAAFGSDLARRLGTGATAPPDLLARVQDAAGRSFTGVFAPDSADGVAEVLALCSAEQWPVVPLGAATWWHPRQAAPTGVSAGRRPPVLLSTVRLDRITEHEPADLVVGVQAGMPLRRLKETLAESRQWLPLDPPASSDATIGAAVALAAAGPLRAAHGTPRDMALGIEIATGDGRLLRFGGRVVKNVAGYDGVRLTVGSRGTIGVITAIYLRVRGAPRADRTLTIACGAGQEGARRGAGLALAVRSAVACDAIELLSPPVARHIGGAGLRERIRDEWTLLIRLLGSEAAVAEGVDRVRAASAGAAEAFIDVPAEVWQTLERLEADADAALRLSGPATGLADGLALAEALTGTVAAATPDGQGWMTAAHGADGIIRVWHPPISAAAGDIPDTPGPPGGHSDKQGWTVRYERGDPKGSATAEGTVESRSPGQPQAVAALRARIRAVFDPAGILPGAEE